MTMTDKIASDVSSAPPRPPVVLTEEALRIHRQALVFDGHNDLPWKVRTKGHSSFETLDLAVEQPELHTDIARLKTGGLGAQFWSAFVPVSTIHEGGATRHALEQIDLIHRMAQRYPDTFEMAFTADDVLRIHASGKIASLIGIEGGHTIENSLGVLRMFHALGVRYMTLTHVESIDWADASTDESRHGGLTEFGEEVIREMNRLGMLVDLSHVSDGTAGDVLRVSRAPVIASHSSAYALAAHPRNLSDELLRGIRDNNGVVMVNFYSGFVEPEAAQVMQHMFKTLKGLRSANPDERDFEEAVSLWRRDHPMPSGTIHMVVDHIDHVVKVAGIDHVGLGSDYDGVTTLPDQLEDVSTYPYITQELLNRGYAKADIHKILGSNALRALRDAEGIAKQLND